MQQTRAWLFAFKRAFKANYDAPPPPNQDEFLGLLQMADERQAEEEAGQAEQPRPPKGRVHH